MRVLHAAAECYPVVRTGGLGDVLAALPPAQRAAGLDARLLLPGYPAVREALEEARPVARLDGLPGAAAVTLLAGRFAGSEVPVYAIEAPELYDRPGNPYLGPDGLDWPDNVQRFGLLGWIAARLGRGGVDPGWQADIVHAHDWHAGLAPAYLVLGADSQPTPAGVFTIHNLAFQGLFPAASMEILGLPGASFTIDGLEFWGSLSFMKAGLVTAGRVTTVSPGYAKEIATPEFGCGLDGVIRARGGDVVGILNGVDETTWTPAGDPALARTFDRDDLAGRAVNRRALLDLFGLDEAGGPLFGVVSRLSEQKGLDLVLAALPVLLGCGGTLVLLGTGDAALEAGFQAAAEAAPGRIGLRLGYDDRLAHLVFGGSDAVLVPSRFEPCGLTQLYAMRYGALPVVRRTGGLGDTVHDASAEALRAGVATGIVFEAVTAAAVGQAIERTAALFADRATWRSVQQTAMAQRFSWRDAAASYQALYRGLTAAP